MNTTKYIFWQDDNMWLGYLEDYSDYLTQGGDFKSIIKFSPFGPLGSDRTKCLSRFSDKIFK